MRLHHSILQVRKQHRKLWVVGCPQLLGYMVGWEALRMRHAGGIQTLRRVQLDWHWLGMSLDVKRMIHTCQVR